MLVSNNLSLVSATQLINAQVLQRTLLTITLCVAVRSQHISLTILVLFIVFIIGSDLTSFEKTDNVPYNLVALRSFRYSHQQVEIRWLTVLSGSLCFDKGTRLWVHFVTVAFH